MSDLWVFGYGSLVNPATHVYAEYRPATLCGWRRSWEHYVDNPTRLVTGLTAAPDPNTDIQGLIARVPAAEWPGLDAREAGYRRVDVTNSVTHDLTGPVRIITYQSQTRRPADPGPILQSYLDCVLQGFARFHGPRGIPAFLSTTDGWQTPIRRDRHAPLYPRAVPLEKAEAASFDTALNDLGVSWCD